MEVDRVPRWEVEGGEEETKKKGGERECECVSEGEVCQ